MVIILKQIKEKFCKTLNNKFIKKNIFVYIYVFIIFSSMLPNKDNINNISKLNTIIPGINRLSNDDKKNNNELKYSFKLFEIFQNIF